MAPEPPSSGGMMSQAEIEALMGSMNTGQEAESTPEPAMASAPQSSGGMISQAEIETVMGSVNTEQEQESIPASAPEPPASSDGMIGQSEIEALMAEMNSSQEAENQPEHISAPESAAVELSGNDEVLTTDLRPELDEVAQTAASTETEQPANMGQRQPDSIFGSKLNSIMGMIAGTIFTVFGLPQKISQAIRTAYTGSGRQLLPGRLEYRSNRRRLLSLKTMLTLAAWVILPIFVTAGVYTGVKTFSNFEQRERTPEDRLAEMGIKVIPDEFVRYAGRGNAEVVNLFIESGMPVDSYRKGDGYTPLMAAAAFGRQQTVNVLLEQGAKVNARDIDGQTALMKAVAYSQTQVVDILLGAGADINVRDIRGNTIVSLALEKKDPQVMEMLTRAGVTGIAEGLAKMKEQAKTAKQDAKTNPASSAKQAKANNNAALSSSPEVTLSAGKAGYVQVGRPVSSLYSNYNKNSIVGDTDYSEGMPYPIVKIYLDGQNRPSLTASVRITNQGQQQVIDGIRVYDERFKTDKGVGINSTLGDLRRAGGFSSIRYLNDSLFAESSGMMFELDVTMKNLPSEWLKTGDVNLLPDDMKITGILIK